MPFLFWWNTWFGRQLPDKQISEYLRDEKHPRRIQHALVQLGERMGRHNAGAARWYPEMIRLSSYPIEEVRNTDAWVMGQDTSGPGFHETLLKMLQDQSPMVRGNAALSLVRFGKLGYGHEQTMELRSPISGRIRTISVATGTSVTAGTELASVDPGDEQVWEALRALYLIGQVDDLPAIRTYQRELPEISDRVRQQALLTEKSIRERAAAHP